MRQAKIAVAERRTAYPLMQPSLEVEWLLAADEAGRWMGLVKPSRR